MIELTIQEIRKKQKFVRFLKENNAYYKFIKYFNKDFKYLYNSFNYKKTNDYSFNFFVQHYTIKNEYFIPNAFVWNHTDCPQLWDRLTNKEIYLRYD